MENTMGRAPGTRTLEAVAGALVLAIGMGFGRFSFTGMYPLMVREFQSVIGHEARQQCAIAPAPAA